MTTQLRLAIAIMGYGGQLVAQHARMWLELGSCLLGSTDRFQLVMFDVVDVNPVDRARNFALARAFGVPADWLLMIDADTWVEGYDDSDAGFQLCRMISEAAHMEATCVVAPVRPRTMHADVDPGLRTHQVMAYRHAENGDGRKLEPLLLAHEPRGLVAIDAAATAIMAIDLRKIGEARFQFTDELSEDLNFCKQLKEANTHSMTIRCDTRVRTGHASRSMPLYSR